MTKTQKKVKDMGRKLYRARKASANLKKEILVLMKEKRDLEYQLDDHIARTKVDLANNEDMARHSRLMEVQAQRIQADANHRMLRWGADREEKTLDSGPIPALAIPPVIKSSYAKPKDKIGSS
jgi:hypothetical protein